MQITYMYKKPSSRWGPRDAGVPVEILSAVERLGYKKRLTKTERVSAWGLTIKSIHITVTEVNQTERTINWQLYHFIYITEMRWECALT